MAKDVGNVSIFSASKEARDDKREELRAQVIKKHGAKLELIAPSKPKKRKSKSRKKKRPRRAKA